jgi:hypothetical protein
MQRQLAIINHSTLVTDAQVLRWLPALQKQILLDFAPYWGVTALLKFYARRERVPASAWRVVLLDSATDNGFLGVHSVAARRQPVAYVYANKALEAGAHVSLILSHEILELLADPDVNITHWIERPRNAPLLFGREICDPCQDAAYSYERDGVQLSDFITPAWFERFWRRAETPFDFLRHISTPLQILPGGYMSVCRVDARPVWREIDHRNRKLSFRHRGKPGSRRARRAEGAPA